MRLHNKILFGVLVVAVLGLAGWGLSAVAASAGPLAAVGLALAVNSAPLAFGNLQTLGLRQLTTVIPAFNGVAASSIATTKLPRNMRLHALFLQYKTNANQATIEADITRIQIVVNGKVVRDFSSAQLNLINAMNGIAFKAGMIPIFFSEPWRATPEGSEYLALLAYESLGVGDVEIWVTIAAGAAAPTLGGIMAFDYQLPADQVANPDLRTVMHWLPRVTPCAAAFTASAPLTPQNFLPNVRSWLHRIHSFDAVITQQILRDGNTPFWNETTTQLDALLTAYRMTKQSNTFHCVLDWSQQYVDGLPVAASNSLAVDFVTSGAATGSQFSSVIELRKALDLS